MTHEQIAALVLEENYSLLFGRLLADSVVPEGEQVYWYDSEQEGTEYDKWKVNAALVKPSIAEIEAEFVEYKTELTAAEDARLAELARIAALQARWDAIPDIRLAMEEAGLLQPNDALLLKEIIENNDEAKMAALEGAVSAVSARIAQQNLLLKAAAKRNLGLQAIDLMAALNDSKGLTGEQVGAMLTALEIPNKLLSSGSIGTAIGYITTMSLPANVTESDRAQILAFLSSGLTDIEARFA